MAITDESTGNGFYMPVAPAYNGGNGNGFGFGGDWAWILLLLVLFGGNGWGNGFGGGYGNDLYPWMNQSNQINGGFRDQMLGTQINGIQSAITSGFGDVQNSLCSGFAGVNATINGVQNAMSQQMYANQIADLQQSFALQSQLAQCCCDNRAAVSDLKYTVATENCADRAAVSDGIRDVITAQTANTQAILDKLCALELDGYKRENDQLRTQLNMANLSASQTAQNAFISQGFANEVDALYNRLNSCPVPTVPVYGRQPIFTCGGNTGCGCGCGA